MTTAYRLVMIGDDGNEREAGIIGELSISPNTILVISLPRNTLEADLVRLRSEWREMTDKLPAWNGRPTIIVWAGDVQFAALTLTETPDA